MKVAIIGAGSAFGSRISIDILSREPLQDTTIALIDINEERLETVRAFVQRAIDHHKLPAKVIAGTDRKELLGDSDFVLISVSIGGPAYYDKPFEDEMRIPEKYGIIQTVADTIGPGGVFRGLRTAPPIIDFVRDIDELCPNAQIINYTNPMAILTWTIFETAQRPVVGLCHGVQGTSKRIAKMVDVPYDEMSFWCAGVNHMAWFTQLEHNGEDLTPRLREAGKDPKNYKGESVRFDVMEQFGYFCTESSRHTCEYVPYFRQDRELLKEKQEITWGVKGRRQSWYEDMGVKASEADSIELNRSVEYASGIMEAMATNVPFRIHGNVRNDGLITNLPQGACVEVPCLVDKTGVNPCFSGDLPAQCAALCRTNVNVQELTVKAIRERSKEAAFHALLLDPITSAALNFDQARAMFDEMWEADAHLLEYYS